MSDLFYVFNDIGGDHHIIPVDKAVLHTRISGKRSVTTIHDLQVDETTFNICTIEKAIADRATWGKDMEHEFTTAVIK